MVAAALASVAVSAVPARTSSSRSSEAASLTRPSLGLALTSVLDLPKELLLSVAMVLGPAATGLQAARAMVARTEVLPFTRVELPLMRVAL